MSKIKSNSRKTDKVLAKMKNTCTFDQWKTIHDYFKKKGMIKELRCHEEAEITSRLLGIKRVDGVFMGMQHSWNVLPSGTIFDMSRDHVGDIFHRILVRPGYPSAACYMPMKLGKNERPVEAIVKKGVKLIKQEMEKTNETRT